MSTSRTLADLAISDNGFIFDPLAGATFSVNATGLCVLQSLKEGLGPAAIAERLSERFDKATPPDAARDVDEFIRQLRQHNLIAADSIATT
ncbi:MAG: PqqD family protein [Polyangia bacterium]